MFYAIRSTDAWGGGWVGVSMDTEHLDFSMEVCLEGFVETFGFTPEPGVYYKIEVLNAKVTKADPVEVEARRQD